MSQGNAAAIRRRVKNAEIQSTLNAQPGSSNTNNNSTTNRANNMSIDDAFRLINNRLVSLETNSMSIPQQQNDVGLQPYLEEYNNRFDLIAREIGELKETVLKLQTFTMDVNKTLFDERIKLLGDIESVGDILRDDMIDDSLNGSQDTNIVTDTNSIKNMNVSSEIIQ